MNLHILTSVLFCATLLYLVDATTPRGSTALRQSRNTDACNDYVDKFVRDFVNDKDYASDPYMISDKSFVVYKKVLFINYTGEIYIKEGHIYGITTLHREADVILDNKGKSIRLKIYLAAGELGLKGSGTIKMMGHGPSVDIDAQVTYISMILELVPGGMTGESPKVSDFDIEEVKDMKVKISGLGPLNFMLNTFIKTTQMFFRRTIRLAFELNIKRYLADKFEDHVVPLECLQRD